MLARIIHSKVSLLIDLSLCHHVQLQEDVNMTKLRLLANKIVGLGHHWLQEVTPPRNYAMPAIYARTQS